jgi:hypothetical protein
LTAADGHIAARTKIVNNGPAHQRWNIVILSDGYRASQIPSFVTNAKDVANGIKSLQPFKEYWEAVNVYRVDVESTDSGADDPAACGGSGTTPATYFDSTFCTGGIERLLTVNSVTATTVARNQVPEVDSVIIVVNSPKYGGSGDTLNKVSVMSLHADAIKIARHEIGHSNYNLADEYPTLQGCASGEAGHDNYLGGEPSRPNVTTNTDRRTNKWRELVLSSTPMPTTSNADCTQCDPQASPVSAGTVGTFEGAFYFHCGVYRPEFDCIMRDLNTPSLCAVCQRHIRHELRPYIMHVWVKKFVQTILSILGYKPGAIDGTFGPKTEVAIRTFQSSKRLVANGIVGRATWKELLTSFLASPKIKNMAGKKGIHIKLIQYFLSILDYSPGPIDGTFGPKTEAAIDAFKSDNGLSVNSSLATVAKKIVSVGDANYFSIQSFLQP